MNLKNIKEDIDVVAPFIERLIMRLREKHVNLLIEVTVTESPGDISASLRIRRMLSEMERNGIRI